ncbi:MAG: amino acid permease [Candidatus Aminicenantes bacterium]|nr:amino acid permease [Candidatus Aminicenantes bacterium]
MKLPRTLSLLDGLAIIIGITIGAGIYSTPQIIAGYLSSFNQIIILWIIVGLFVFLGGLIYAELGTRFPHTGGEYVYLYRAFGPLVGFLFGWSQLFIIRTSPAAGLALVTADYLSYFFPLSPIVHKVVATSVILILGLLNIIGLKWASAFQKFTTTFKVLGLFLFVIGGLILSQGLASGLNQRLEPLSDLSPITRIIAALMMVFFAHTGFERLGYSAGEMKNPRKTIPLSLALGIGLIVIIYCLVNLIYHLVLGMEGVRGNTIVASAAAVHLAGPIGASFVAILVILSATGSINGTMMTATRVYYAMARDGLFLSWLNYVHPRFRTPSRAVMAHCLWALVILFLRSKFEVIAAGMVFGILIFLALSTFSLIKFRLLEVGDKEGYRVPLFPLFPIVYLTGLIILIVFRSIFEWRRTLIDLIFIASGLPFYFFQRHFKGRKSSRLIIERN